MAYTTSNSGSGSKPSGGYHVVPPPYTENYMPPRADLSFAGLDDSVYKCKPSVPIIGERESDSDNDSTISPISDQTKHTPIKIDFVKPVECVECGENEKQVEKPTSFTQNPKCERVQLSSGISYPISGFSLFITGSRIGTSPCTHTFKGNGYSRKRQKQGQKRQNQTQNGKDRKRQSHSKPKVKSQSPRSTKVNPGKVKVKPDKAKAEKAKKIQFKDQKEWILQESGEKSQKPGNNGHKNGKKNDMLAIRVKLGFDPRDEIYGMESEIDQMDEIIDWGFLSRKKHTPKG
nr:hypothetical protein [Tanacetum cinerariifolium]